ncbi:hypothetical protein MKW92_049191, partial [Papaver armeniacum]
SADGIRKCLDNSHPSKGQHQNHGFGRKWREEDPHLSSSSNSGKSWADMVEEEEEDEECSSLFSDCSAEKMVESVSEWSSDDSSYMSQEDNKWNDKNEAVYSSDDNLSDAEDNLQWKFEAADINGEFRKPAARCSLYFDQKQEHEHEQLNQILLLIHNANRILSDLISQHFRIMRATY